MEKEEGNSLADFSVARASQPAEKVVYSVIPSEARNLSSM